MTDFGPPSQASSQPAEKFEHNQNKVIFQTAAKHRGQLWKKIGLVGSVAVMGGQPVLAQIDMPAGDAIAPPIAAETTPVVTPTPSETSAPVEAPPVVAAPKAAAPVFSSQAAPPVLMAETAPPEVEAITSQVEIVIPAPETAPDGAAPGPEANPETNPETNPGTTTPGVDIVRPSDVVPGEIPTVEDAAAEYGGVFVDPTAYSEGATVNPDAPEVVISERSTGCEYKVEANNVNGCGGATSQPTPSRVADAPDAPAAVAATPGNPGRSLTVGPVSIGRSGVRFSEVGATTVAGREYYNTVAKPLVELQAGESFIFPLASPSPITSLFGWRWHPIHNDYRFHAGTDLGAPQGTPILATQSGQVSLADYLGGYGLTVILRHNDNTLESRYAHMSHILVRPGEWVEQGEVIGLVGSTGNSTGPHLHFELHQLTSQGWNVISPNEVLSYALANLNQGIGGGRNPLALQGLNIIPRAEAANPVQAVLPKTVNTETLVTDAPHFRPAQPNAQ
ncbi:peptidoglycan DD-metalloendopeptidase family protein [Leptothoe sp. PORK10 BA2]|uniref:peptidoglycan DD-metalloendopeptidase family protein n=1 Tax=Leptothoe sp. PORK10 BA2 TaxID=3110254 RepID=UPI002B1ECF76|nr:peptidoglycan DD-metalloendopeptidase family protein [Leptothoe sp. PORK10 BA2]MEA5464090.1 peptidoglycan DD-metalloendopeptidase family protein [Leptothoe sp. PORK10 BA2]